MINAFIALIVFIVICVVLFYVVNLLRPKVGEPMGTIILVIAIIIALLGFLAYMVPALRGIVGV